MRGSYILPLVSVGLLLLQLDGPELSVALEASLPIIHAILLGCFAICVSVERLE